jgi:hypothetical protein
VPLRAGPDEPDALVVAPDRLAVMRQRLWIVQQELDQASPGNTRLLVTRHCVAADETTGLVELDREPEPSLEPRIAIADAVAEVAIGLLQARAAECLQPRVPEPESGPGRDDPIVDVSGVLGGDVEFPADLDPLPMMRSPSQWPGLRPRRVVG